MKNLAYLRRSRQDLEKERITGEDTLAEQKRILQRLVIEQELRIEPKDWYEEVASGDKIADRPVFQYVLELLQSGNYQSIIVKEISRLGRGDMEDAGKIMKILKRYSIQIITPYRTFDINNPMDARYIRFELFMAREEFELTKERFVSAKHSGALEGRVVCGKPTFGYHKDPKTRKLVIFEPEAEIVRLIYNMVLNDDLGVCGIKTKLTKMGVKPPGKPRVGKTSVWNTHTIKRILTNPIYIGTMINGKRKLIEGVEIPQPREKWIMVPNTHPAIIDPESFELVQKKLEIRKPPIAWDKTPKRLAGLVKCKRCGRAMVHRNHPVDGRDFALCVHYCKNTWVNYDQLEAAILKYLNLITINPTLVEEKILLLSEKPNTDLSAFENIIQGLESELKSAREQLDFIFEQFEKRIYDTETFNARRTKQEKKIKKIKQSIEHAKKENDLNKIAKEKSFEYAKAVKDVLQYYYTADTDKKKNDLLKEIIERVDFYRKDRGYPFEIEIWPRFSFNLSSTT